jgi:NAD(P)-dependent dehydrogenase (short-subunit alcohol dehydrogenase family)
MKTAEEVLDGIDLGGTTALVTGASAGIGAETVRALAAHGAHVVAAARDTAKAEAALAGMPGAIEIGTLDLASLASVRSFAAWFTEKHDRLQLLVNNAGIMATPFDHTADGFELQFGTNHLGHFLLTTLLLPVLRASAPARIVNLTSAGHRASDVVFDDVNFEHRPYNKWDAYGQSKTANILFTVELERRLADDGVHAYAVHPGMVATELGRHMRREDVEELQQRAGNALPEIQPVSVGAATSVWAATAPELQGRGGVYLADCAISDDHTDYALDPTNARRLWALSEELVTR